METTNHVWTLNDRISNFLMIFKDRHFAKKCFASRIKTYKEEGYKTIFTIKTERSITIYLHLKNTDKIETIELEKQFIY